MNFTNTKRRLVLLFENEGEYRYKRISEEADRMSLPILPINIHKTVLSQENIFFPQEKIAFNETDIFWALSNASINHALERFLELHHFPIWPSADSIKLSDKFYSNAFFSSIGIPTPKTCLISSLEMLDQAINIIGGFPLIVKKKLSTKGQFVELVYSKEDIISFISTSEKLQVDIPENKSRIRRCDYILQEYISESFGVDFRVLCLNGNVLGVIKRSNKTCFKSNISLGGVAEHIETDPELEHLAKKVCKNANLFYAGIDFVKGKDGYMAIEINTSAQFTGFEKVTKINVAKNILGELLAKSSS